MPIALPLATVQPHEVFFVAKSIVRGHLAMTTVSRPLISISATLFPGDD